MHNIKTKIVVIIRANHEYGTFLERGRTTLTTEYTYLHALSEELAKRVASRYFAFPRRRAKCPT